MAISPAGFYVKPPMCIDTSKYGLINVIKPQTNLDPHWMASGIQWVDDLCGPPITGFIDECPPASGYTKPAQRELNFCTADPFLALGSFECPPVGTPASEAFEIARRRLLAWESYQVENILWTGVSANGLVNPSFAFGNPDCDILPEDISPGGAVDVVQAIGLLEQRLSSLVPCGGTIHVPSGLIPFLAASYQLVLDEDGFYRTPGGLRIIAGDGYPGSGPANIPAIAGETWVFGTGPLVAVRSNVTMVPNEFKEAVDRQINNVTVRAERFYSIGWSCTLLAIRVKLSCACC